MSCIAQKSQDQLKFDKLAKKWLVPTNRTPRILRVGIGLGVGSTLNLASC